MIKLYPISFRKMPALIALLLLSALGIRASVHPVGKVDTIKSKSSRYSLRLGDTVKNKISYSNTHAPIKINFVPFKPAVIRASAPVASAPYTPKNVQVQVLDNKLMNNLKVYPNPVEDQLNFSYHMTKEANVTIKVMDVLGNEITTLFSQKMAAGDQVNTFNVGTKLSTGFYFIRFVAGSQTLVKRISVL